MARRRIALLEVGSAPELSAPAARLSAFASHLRDSGWDVNRLTRTPGRSRSSAAGTDRRWRVFARWLASLIRAEGDVGPAALMRLPKLARAVQADVLLVSVPPFSGLFLPALVSQDTVVVVDFRDAWLHNLRLPPVNAVSRRLEAAALRRAAAIVHAGTDLLGERLAATSGLPPCRVVAVPNGVLPVDLPLESDPSSKTEHGPLDLVFAGSVYSAHQLRPVALAVTRLGPEVARLEIVGPSSESQIRRAVGGAKHGVVIAGPLSRPQLYARLLAADLLVLALPDTFPHRFSIPVKAYEYFALGVPILAVVPASSSLLSLAGQTQVHRVEPGDCVGLESAIRRLATTRSLLTRQPVRPHAFSRAEGLRQLGWLLDAVLPPTGSSSPPSAVR